MIVGLIGIVLIARPVEGQDTKNGSAKTELGASVFFGNTSQSAVTTSFSNERMAVQLSFVDAYDTEAEARGARSNNDGQIFFSLAATF